MRNERSVLHFVRGAAAAAVMLTSFAVHAVPSPGAPLPAAHVVDSEDNRFELASVRGRPILVVYEDKDSAHVNDAFKAELGRLARTGNYRNTIALVPVADVRSYDYWPVRGFVKDAIRDETKKQGTRIYCDWNGQFSRALSLQPGTSSIVLFGRSGRVLFSKAGRLSTAEIQRLIELLRAEAQTTAS